MMKILCSNSDMLFHVAGTNFFRKFFAATCCFFYGRVLAALLSNCLVLIAACFLIHTMNFQKKTHIIHDAENIRGKFSASMK